MPRSQPRRLSRWFSPRRLQWSGTLIITDLPVITSHSATRHVLRTGFNLTLRVAVATAESPTFQWYHDGRVVEGATTDALTLTNAAYADTGAYWVVVTNSSGS